jgi:hypothetical protein
VDAATVWPAVAAIGTLAAAGVAAWAARQSSHSAAKSNAAAGTLATIERDRRHDELDPEFKLEFTEAAGDHANVLVSLTGGRLESLDEVTFTILDETGKDHWSRGLPDGVTQEEAEEFVWGPWQFNTGASVQVMSNRQSKPRRYSRVSGKNWELLPLTRTRPGHWMALLSQERWQKDHAEQPIRFLIICRREGYAPWTLLRNVVAGHAGPEEGKQASEILVRPRTCDGAQARVLPQDATKPVHMLVVTNSSNRPIRNVAAKIRVSGEISPGEKLADVVGMMEKIQIASGVRDEVLGRVVRSSQLALLYAGDVAAFAWSLDEATYPKADFIVRFRDENELDWEVGPDLRLARMTSRDW